MLDLCKIFFNKRSKILWLTMGAIVFVAFAVLKVYWIAYIYFLAFYISYFYGLYKQARRLARGEEVYHWWSGKPMQIDEPKVRNDLISVDLTWNIIPFIIFGLFLLDINGILPRGFWAGVFLLICLIVRFGVRGLLNRYA